jgi:hypothetical protein
MDLTMQETVMTLDTLMLVEQEFAANALEFEPGKTDSCGTAADVHLCYGSEYGLGRGDLVLSYGMSLDFEDPTETPVGLLWISLTARNESRQFMAIRFSSKEGWQIEGDQEELQRLAPEERLLILLFGAEATDEQAFIGLRLMIQVFVAHASGPRN